MEKDERLRSDLEALRLDRSAPLETATSRRRRWPIVAGGLLLALVVAGGLARRAREVALGEVTLADAAAAASVPVLSGSGYLVPGDEIAEIGARVPGRVAKYLVDEGQAIEAGAPMVQLDDREYRSVLEQANARLASAKASLALARAELRRGRELMGRDYLAPSELDVRAAKAQTAQAAVQEAQAAVHRAEIDLEDTLLRAPSAGVVLKKMKEAGEIAVPGGFAGSGDLIRLANLEDLRAEIDVNENDLPRVHMGQRAEVVPDAMPDARFRAEVVELDPQVDRQKGTLKVQVRLLERDPRLLPDMSVRVSFLGDAPKAGDVARTALAPAAAVHRGLDGRAYVWVVESGAARRVYVEIAGMLGQNVRVTSGLAGGERVVLGEEPKKDGERVREKRTDAS